MKKLGYVVAALGALVIAAPTLASAETMVIKRGHHHGMYGARAEYGMHRDYGLHRGWHHRDRVVVIKRHHRHMDY
ncbi:hypothetical protein JJB99_28425 [Bradyrhizobium diazoefficiens]|uniref:hypothetical protein n=1 Tax=Bradyrhizobium diazoefficiens TaxID=1355477 RepID=UPI00190BB981|nr:hypothetical protein [Bradyrhizobium diazoefficiens]QQO13300.1 hypothetical protein JJB99_28425 [Bradyrhizobium diazoefficiens]